MTKPYIGIVDDESEFRKYLKARLQRAFPSGSIVTTSETEEALRLVRTRDVDAIVSDLHIHPKGGLAFLGQVESIAPHTRRILVTGYPDQEAADEALRAGRIDLCFAKPIDFDLFLAGLQSLLSPGTLRGEQEVSRQRRMLIVDDLRQIGEVVATIAARLPAGRLAATIETDPREAQRRIRSERFDIILTDYRMPHLNGIDLLIEARRVQPQAKRILLTGYNEVPEDAARLASADVDAYLHKPISAQDGLLFLIDAASDDPEAMTKYREQARLLERKAERGKTALDLDDA